MKSLGIGVQSYLEDIDCGFLYLHWFAALAFSSKAVNRIRLAEPLEKEEHKSAIDIHYTLFTS